MPIDLRIAEHDWLALRKYFKTSFRPGFPPETGAIGLLGDCNVQGKREFLLAKVCWPKPGDVKISNHGSLVFHSSYIRRAHLEMRSEGLAGLVTFHTHPGSDESVRFSPFDDDEDPLLVENLRELESTTQLISVVVGKNSQRGRWWADSKHCHELSRLVVVGESLSYYLLNGRPEPPPSSPAAIFDRALILTNAGALSLLSKMKIAVVGASGTGSLMCELLARAGCADLMVIDDDIVKDINLNRILYATSEDEERQAPKVDVLRRGIEGLGIGCRVEAICGNILDKEVLA